MIIVISIYNQLNKLITIEKNLHNDFAVLFNDGVPSFNMGENHD